jgi:tRNA A-37 threonylcarbamoyl transferase component Bud32
MYERGIYHRDIKNWNIICKHEGGYCLIDLGLANKTQEDRLPQDKSIPMDYR